MKDITYKLWELCYLEVESHVVILNISCFLCIFSINITLHQALEFVGKSVINTHLRYIQPVNVKVVNKLKILGSVVMT